LTASTTARRTAQGAAIALGVLTLALGLAIAPLDAAAQMATNGGPVADWLTNVSVTVPSVAVGTVLAVRRPGNPIGWLILAILLISNSPAPEYNVLDYRLHHGTLPLGSLSVLFEESWPLLLVLVTLLLWAFPDGALPSGRWRRPVLALVVADLALGLTAWVSILLAVRGHHVPIDAAGNLANSPGTALAALRIATIGPALAAWLAWVIFQVPSYRRADGERRQQLKWLYSGGAIFLVSLVVVSFVIPLALGKHPGATLPPAVTDLGSLALGALPVCLGVAVLKYRLYELDRIISRVVSYALITGLLVGVYTGLILLTSHVLPFRSAAAVAVCTLITAALFNPLRRRVQHVVDRRFNRSRYDAEAMVTAFTTRLQHTVDLDTVQRDLAGITQDAFQPEHVSVWLAPATASPPEPLR
jgi:hypothetical protein